jgi:hypothetical protein
MTQQTTQEFITSRSKAILKQIQDLRQELAVLRALKTSLSGKSIITAASQYSRNQGGMTFQDMIVDVLNDQPNKNAEALKIIELIRVKHGKVIQRTSISPQLSRLKFKGVLYLRDNIWSLTEKYKAEKNEGPAGPSDDGDTSSDLLGTVPLTPARESHGGGT